MKKIILAIILNIVLVMACGEDIIEVEYTLTCESVTCDNADNVYEYTVDSCERYTCRWQDASYKGNEGTVIIYFRSCNGGCWKLIDECFGFECILFEPQARTLDRKK